MYPYAGGNSILSEGMSVWLVVLAVCGIVFFYIASGNSDKISRAERAISSPVQSGAAAMTGSASAGDSGGGF